MRPRDCRSPTQRRFHEMALALVVGLTYPDWIETHEIDEWVEKTWKNEKALLPWRTTLD